MNVPETHSYTALEMWETVVDSKRLKSIQHREVQNLSSNPVMVNGRHTITPYFDIFLTCPAAYAHFCAGRHCFPIIDFCARQLKQSQTGKILPGGCIAFLARQEGKAELRVWQFNYFTCKLHAVAKFHIDMSKCRNRPPSWNLICIWLRALSAHLKLDHEIDEARKCAPASKCSWTGSLLHSRKPNNKWLQNCIDQQERCCCWCFVCSCLCLLHWPKVIAKVRNPARKVPRVFVCSMHFMYTMCVWNGVDHAIQSNF